jgi:hypothetical protein
VASPEEALRLVKGRLLERDMHFGVAAGLGGVHTGGYRLDVLADKRPLLVPKHNKRYLSARKVLLVTNILVGAQQDLVSSVLRLLDEISVF